MRSGSWHCYLEPSRNPANTPALPWDPAHHRGLSNHPVAGLPSDSRTLHVLYLAELQGHFLATCPGSMLGTEVAPGSSWRHRAEPLPVPPSFSMQRCWEHSCYCHSWRRLTWGPPRSRGICWRLHLPPGGGWGLGSGPAVGISMVKQSGGREVFVPSGPQAAVYKTGTRVGCCLERWPSAPGRGFPRCAEGRGS